MLNGPFRDDVELIFDNAVLFNPPDDWIAVAAVALKKSVTKKIDAAAYAAEKKNASGDGNRNQRKSMYVDEDSDVDIYEYESRFADTYSMPSDWSCRKATAISSAAAVAIESKSNDDHKPNAEEDSTVSSEQNQGYTQEMAELLAMQKRFGEAETSSLRRSSRETRPTTTARTRQSNKKKDAVKKTEGLEYYWRIDSSTADGEKGQETKSLPSTTPCSRFDVEVFREKRHEDHYAKLYQKYEKELTAKDDDGFAVYSSGSFPPYLGRVVPYNNRHGCHWEIRPPFVVPALRWVIRGLVHSGHLTATEPMFSGGAGASNNDTSAGSILTNDVYYWDPESTPFEILDTRELQRKKRAGKSDGEDSSEDEVEMSEYEKLRAERVARNAERLKALGLA
mmetsp:Transcript_19669/g.41412  ORF Transcript_19669/g.41412 Transcript_19669/m.41412 type:complete len:394 (+) Transcript_19669:417-1598(+)